MILIEETEYIKTSVPVFQKYLQIADDLLKSNKNLLYTGEFLENSCYAPEFEKKFSEVCRVPANIRDAAEIFLLNIPSWRCHEFIKKNYADAEVLEIENELLEITNGNYTDDHYIEWGIRQIVLVKSYKH